MERCLGFLVALWHILSACWPQRRGSEISISRISRWRVGSRDSVFFSALCAARRRKRVYKNMGRIGPWGEAWGGLGDESGSGPGAEGLGLGPARGRVRRLDSARETESRERGCGVRLGPRRAGEARVRSARRAAESGRGTECGRVPGGRCEAESGGDWTWRVDGARRARETAREPGDSVYGSVPRGAERRESSVLGARVGSSGALGMRQSPVRPASASPESAVAR